MDIQEGGELLKVLYATIGKRPTKIIAWILAIIVLIFAVRWGMEGIDWITNRFIGTQVTWGAVLNALFAIAISVVFLGIFVIAFGLLLAIIIRIGINKTRQHKVQDQIDIYLSFLDITRSTLKLDDEQYNIVSNLIEQAEVLKRGIIKKT